MTLLVLCCWQTSDWCGRAGRREGLISDLERRRRREEGDGGRTLGSGCEVD